MKRFSLPVLLLTASLLPFPARAASLPALGSDLLSELPAEEETFGPAVTDADGRYQVFDAGDAVYAWIRLPSDMRVDEVWTNRSALSIVSEDTDSLNADAEYYVYNAAEGYQDFNMDDPLEVDAASLAADEEFTVEGPTEPQAFALDGRDYMGASLFVSYLPEDAAPNYTMEYLIWTHLNDEVIVTCLVHVTSANPNPGLSMEDAALIFMGGITEE